MELDVVVPCTAFISRDDFIICEIGVIGCIFVAGALNPDGGRPVVLVFDRSVGVDIDGLGASPSNRRKGSKS